jgi:hypothetical protein
MARLKASRLGRLLAVGLLVAMCLLISPIQANNNSHNMTRRAPTCRADQRECNGACVPLDHTCEYLCKFDERQCGTLCVPWDQPCEYLCKFDERECETGCVPLAQVCGPTCAPNERSCGTTCISVDDTCVPVCSSGSSPCGDTCILDGYTCDIGSNTLCETISPTISTRRASDQATVPYVSYSQLFFSYGDR